MSLRNAVLASVAAIAITACSGSEIATPGTADIPTAPTPTPAPPPPPPTVTGFAARTTAPASAADCPAGTVFIADIGLALDPTQTSNFCSLGAEGGSTVTGTLNIPLSADPILISGTVFIGDASGTSADVTFAAGQQFVSQSETGVVDLLVISRGSTLNAVGTSTNPIVFTSMQDFEDDLLPNGTSSFG
ncbi:MAG: hypothetical protein AAGJ50_10210, partial [Pseudomonadota bacterium]